MIILPDPAEQRGLAPKIPESALDDEVMRLRTVKLVSVEELPPESKLPLNLLLDQTSKLLEEVRHRAPARRAVLPLRDDPVLPTPARRRMIPNL